jgi:FAD/FMN-containing dehydrogenase
LQTQLHLFDRTTPVVKTQHGFPDRFGTFGVATSFSFQLTAIPNLDRAIAFHDRLLTEDKFARAQALSNNAQYHEQQSAARFTYNANQTVSTLYGIMYVE